MAFGGRMRSFAVRNSPCYCGAAQSTGSQSMRRASLYSSSRRPRTSRAQPRATVSPGLVFRARLPGRFRGRRRLGNAPAAVGKAAHRPEELAPRRPRHGHHAPRPFGPPSAAAAAACSVDDAAAGRSSTPPGLRYKRAGRFAAPAAGVVAGALLVLALQGGVGTGPRQLTQEDIDAAVLNTLETQQLPSPAARAAAIIGPSVVRVQAFGPEEADPKGPAESDKGRAKPPQKDASKDASKERPQGRAEVRQGRSQGSAEGRRHRRRHQGQRPDPDQPARRERRAADHGDLRRRHRVRSQHHRRPTRARPGGAAGGDAAGRPAAGHAALDGRPARRRRRGGGGLSVRHRPVGQRQASSPASAASIARPAASDC